MHNPCTPCISNLEGKYVWVGGETCEPGYTEVYENEKWTALTPYPETVTYHCATFVEVDNDQFYVMGGYNYISKENSDSVIRYDFTTGKYETLTQIPGNHNTDICCVHVHHPSSSSMDDIHR